MFWNIVLICQFHFDRYVIEIVHRRTVSDIFSWIFPYPDIPPSLTKTVNLTLTLTLTLTLILTLLTPLLTLTLTEQGRQKCPRGNCPGGNCLFPDGKYVNGVRNTDRWGELWRLLRNSNAIGLVIVSKGMPAVKLCSKKILRFLTRAPVNTGWHGGHKIYQRVNDEVRMTLNLKKVVDDVAVSVVVLWAIHASVTTWVLNIGCMQCLK